MHSRKDSLDLLEAIKKTLAGATGEPPQPVDVRNSVYLSCIATTLLVIAHTLIEKE